MGSRVSVTEHPWGSLVRLDAADVRNALDGRAVEDLRAAFAAEAPGAIVLAGAGDVFCSGGDLATLAAASASGGLEALLATSARLFASLVEQLVACPRPVVAAVRGDAVGGGLSLALACDVRIAGRSTRLVPGWGRWGLPPDGGGSALLALALGPLAATTVLVTGDCIEATSPLAPLLFAQVVDDDAVEATAIAVAERLLAHPGARAAKAVSRPMMRPLIRQLDVEIAALLAAARDPLVAARLAGETEA